MSLLTRSPRVETAGYQCRRNLDAGTGARTMDTRQCRGRMVATWHVASRVPSLRCDVCGRLSAPEVTA